MSSMLPPKPRLPKKTTTPSDKCPENEHKKQISAVDIVKRKSKYILRSETYIRYFKGLIPHGTIHTWDNDPLWPTDASRMSRIIRQNDSLPFCDKYDTCQTRQDDTKQKLDRHTELRTVEFDAAQDANPIVQDYDNMDEYWEWLQTAGQNRVPSMQPRMMKLMQKMGQHLDNHMIADASIVKYK